jgi:acyl-CoA synthetase (NDP forming)
MDLSSSVAKVAALLEPRNIVVVGASDRPGSWPAVVWETVHSHGFKGPIYAINPNRDKIGEERCYRDFASLPEMPDHLVILVPGALAPEALEAGAKAGARSATVFSSGFGEDGKPDGIALAHRLAQIVKATGVAMTGPNCTGNICAQSGLVTLVDHRKLNVKPGPVALVGQSGGVLLYANHILADRGIEIGHLISSGNEIGLSCADYIAFLATEPSTKVIFCYLEAIKDVQRFKAACAMAQHAGKPVIVFKLGSSEAGRKAAMTHTGALSGSTQAFDTVLEGHGAIRVETLDEAIEAIELAIHMGLPVGPNIGALSLSGAYRGILLDGAAGTGLNFPELAPDVEARLSALLSVGASAGNPADGGFTVLTSVDKYVECVDILCDDAGLDLLILQAELPREEGMAASWEERFQRIHDLVAARGKKLAFISMFSRMLTDYSRAVRARLPKVAFVQETRKSLRALDHLVTWSQGLRAAGAEARPAPAAPLPPVAQELRRRALAAERRLVLDERESKALLAAYGIAGAKEMIAVSVEEAVAAADAIGYPVVVKALSEQLLHKSDAGGVILDIANEDSVRAACRQIAATVEERAKIRIESFLVCEQVKGSVELALGLDRDPEMGLLMMVGSGGLLLELIEDVAFAAPPVTVESARGLIDKLKIAKILRGYRGAPAHDIEKIADAIAGLGRLAIDLADVIESLDVNPLVSRPGFAPLALDAAVVLRPLAQRKT